MNWAQLKLTLVFAVFAIIGFGPISPGCLIGMYVVWLRPAWFWELTQALYDDRPVPSPVHIHRTYGFRLQVFAVLVGLFIIDIIPIPVTPMLALPVIFSRPDWFYRVVADVYR